MPKLGRRDRQVPEQKPETAPATLDDFWDLRDRLLRAMDEMEAAATEFDRLTAYGETKPTPAIRAASENLSALYRAHAQTERAWIAAAYRLAPEDRAVAEDWYGGPLFYDNGAVATLFHFWSQGPAMTAIAPYRRYHDLFP